MSNVIAALALVASIFGLLLPWNRARKRGQQALVTGRFVKTPGSTSGANRFIIVNQGPANARDVSVTLQWLHSGQPWDLGVPPPGPMPIPLMAPNDEMHLSIDTTYDDPDFVTATFTWLDDRKEPQSRVTTLSTVGIPSYG